MPDSVQPYSAADLARLRSVQARPQGWSHRVKPQVREHRDEQRRPVKRTLDELGNIVQERWTGQDAFLFLPHLRVRWHNITTEER